MGPVLDTLAGSYGLTGKRTNCRRNGYPRSLCSATLGQRAELFEAHNPAAEAVVWLCIAAAARNKRPRSTARPIVGRRATSLVSAAWPPLPRFACAGAL